MTPPKDPLIDLYVLMCGLALNDENRDQIIRISARYPTQALGLEDRVGFLMRCKNEGGLGSRL